MKGSTLRAAFVAVSLALAFAAAPTSALAQPKPTGTPSGSATAFPVPTPIPTPVPMAQRALATAAPTLPPAESSRSLPYPAYGTPAPGVSTTQNLADVPQRVTLQQAIAIAYAKSPVLAAARAAVDVQRASTDLTATGLKPNVAGTASVTESRTESGTSAISAGTSATGTGSGSGTTTNTSFSAGSKASLRTSDAVGISIRQLIFDGGRIAAQIRAARATADGSVATYQRQLQTVAFNVATAYYNQLAAARNTSVAVASVNLDLVQEQLVNAQIRAGVVARADLATAELQTAQARLAVVRSQATELTAEASIANAVGLDANVTILPIDDAGDPQTVIANSLPVASYDTALKRALALRPDLATTQFAVTSAQETIRANRALRSPTLSATGNTQYASTDVNGGQLRNASSIGASLSFPIFDQGVTNAQVRIAQANLDLALAQLKTQQLTISLAVKQGLVGLVSARAGVDQANAEYAKARVVLESTQAQYKAGVTTLVQLLNSQVSFIQSLSDQVTAVYALRQAEQTLLFATGENGFTPTSDPLARKTGT